jgi:hypothetical protein
VSESALELHGLVRALVEQQTALLQAHAESMRLQRALVERLLESVPAPAMLASVPAPVVAVGEAVPEVASSPPVARESLPAVEVVARDAPPSPAPVVRSDRYYQPAQSPPSRRASPEKLDVLRRVQAVGEVARLIVTFGPHTGETLGQVAQSDPDYLRQLAVSAQRPDVRAAAARVVDALPTDLPHARRAPSNSRRGTWRGAS